VSTPLGQFTPPTDAYTRALAQQATVAMNDQLHDRASNVSPQLRTAHIVSNDGGTPPTCTVTWDEGVTNVAGIRYMSPYVPGSGDLVYTLGMDGIQWVVGKILAVGPIACHVSRYSRNSTTTLTNGSTALIAWQAKDSTGLSEPAGDINASLPSDTFTIPFDGWWSIQSTITWNTPSDTRVGIRIETAASRLAENMSGSALVDPTISVGCERFLAATTSIKIRYMNASGATITLQADGTTTPCYVTIRSLPIHVSGVS
jgi:hypothetical protein